MINTSTIKRFVSLTVFAAGFVLVSGNFSEISAQRDPFQKPGFMKPKPTVVARPKTVVKVEKPVVNYAPPPVEARVEYYKKMREEAATNGTPMPKPTSVMTLSELAVSGIFKTPRGYAAIVEAIPIKLSYTVYPGEKFFDGQLVAVDEGRLVFKKVTKVGEGKFVSSVENKGLKAFGAKVEVAAATPAPTPATVETANTAGGKEAKPVRPTHNPFLSPVDEMNSQPNEAPKEPVKTAAKKPVKPGTKKP